MASRTDQDLKDAVWQTLRAVTYPGYTRDIVSFGLVTSVKAEAGRAQLVLDSSGLSPESARAIGSQIEAAIAKVPGLKSAEVSFKATPPSARPHDSQTVDIDRSGIRVVLAVGSGKGGVGKSTVAANLAVAMAQQGLSVGLMDADAYGPSVPRMLGADPPMVTPGGKIRPSDACGVKCISIGFFVAPEAAVLWRGPMTDKMIRQFLVDVDWGPLDVMVVDLPPGTGDIAIGLAKHAKPDGAVLVTTPQAMAADDVRKALSMFGQLGVPVMGVVENMASFVCPDCGSEHRIFGAGGGRQLAETHNIALLGSVPLEPQVCEDADRGKPCVLVSGSLAGKALQNIASALVERLLKAPLPA